MALAGFDAAEPAQPVHRHPSVIQVPLEYREVESTITEVWLNLHTLTEAQSAQLKIPPVPKGTKLVHGAFQLDKNEFGFVWDKTSGRLYLDLNHNQDFTDDPAGVFDSGEKGFSQKFTNIKLTGTNQTCQWDYLIDLELYRMLGAYVGVRSFYEGKVELGGQTWQIGVVKTPSVSRRGPGYVAQDTPTGTLVIRPWAERGDEFDLSSDTAIGVPLCDTVLLLDNSYAPELVWQQQDQSNKLFLTLTPVEPELGQLELAGVYVHRLVLHGAPKHAAFFYSPTHVLRLPVGTYDTIQVVLERGGCKATAEFNQKVIVTSHSTNILAVGGPLTNSVSVTRRGRVLQMEYDLVGYGGKQYKLVSTNQVKEPEFEIYKGNRRIAHGKFRFG